MRLTAKIRDDHLDNAKFWLIFLVVLGHFIEPVIGMHSAFKAFYLFLHAFHIPALAFIFGYSSKRQAPSKNLLKLLFLYIFFQLVYSFFSQFPFGLLNPHGILWFLLSLLTWRFVLPYYLKLNHPFLISALAGLVAGLLPAIDDFLALSQSLYFLPFFILGYFVSQKASLNPFLFKKFRLLKAGFFILILVTAFFLSPILKDINPEWLYGQKAYGFIGLSWWEGIVSRLVHYIVALLMTFLFFSFIPFSKNKLTTFGQRSLYTLGWHGLFLLWLVSGFEISQTSSGSPYLLALIALVSSFALTFVLSMKWSEKLIRIFWKPFYEWMFGWYQKAAIKK